MISRQRLAMTPSLIARAGLIVALLAAAGCTGDLDGPIDFAVRGGVAGSGDGTPSLHIELDGTATRTSATGTQTTVLDPATMRDLRTKIEHAQVPTLDPVYLRCCDWFTYQLSVLIGGTAYTVMGTKPDQPGDAVEQPAKLQLVFDTLDQLATSSVWQ
jgi:hypothetical protein